MGRSRRGPSSTMPLADWVKAGGTLIVVDDDEDPYNKVREWWNTGDFHDATPRLDLFRRLGLPAAPEGPQHVGKGIVLYDAQSPAALSHETEERSSCGICARRAAKCGGD